MIPDTIELPKIAKFLPVPDQDNQEMYVLSVDEPLSLFWIRQTIPAQIYIVRGPQDESILREVAEWWKSYAANQLNQN